jgi:hypothetical protein
MVQLTGGGTMGPTAIYVHIEEMGKVLTNISETG